MLRLHESAMGILHMMCAGWLGDDVWLLTMRKGRAWAACVE